MVSIETIINMQTWTKQGKMPICKDQQIAYFLVINNVPYFVKKSIPFPSNHNNLSPQQ